MGSEVRECCGGGEKGCNTIEEIWKPVAGYESYFVSSFGRIYSTKSGKILKPIKKNNGYMSVELFNKNGSKQLSIHRIVAKAFIPNPFNFPQINHKDENKENNNVNNLEWCTSKYNMNYGNIAIQRRKSIDYSTEKRKIIARENGKKASKAVIQFSKSGNILNTFNSISEASAVTGTHLSHLIECCKNKPSHKTANGFIWKYKTERDVDL